MSGSRDLPFKCSAVITDVDGTLVTDDRRLTPRAMSAVARLRANDVAFSIVSSRPSRGLRTLIRALDITAPIGAFNGGVIAASDLSIITEHLLSPAVARRTVDMLDARRVQVWVFSGRDWLLRDPGGAYVGLEARTVRFQPNVVKSFDASLDKVAKVVGVSRDFELLARCEGDMRTMLAGSASVARSQPYYLDITHPLASKGAALTVIANLLAVPLAEIAVIGDGGNDVGMFERSGLSIAMGNASLEVQQVADFVTDSNREEGFANAVERFILGADRSSAQVGTTRAGGRAW